MKLKDIRIIATNWDVDVRVTRSKQDIIRDIQTKEGNAPCFAPKRNVKMIVYGRKSAFREKHRES